MMEMERDEAIYYALVDSAAQHDKEREDFTPEEKTLMVCTSNVLERLNDLMDEVNLIRVFLMKMMEEI